MKGREKVCFACITQVPTEKRRNRCISVDLSIHWENKILTKKKRKDPPRLRVPSLAFSVPKGLGVCDLEINGQQNIISEGKKRFTHFFFLMCQQLENKSLENAKLVAKDSRKWRSETSSKLNTLCIFQSWSTPWAEVNAQMCSVVASKLTRSRHYRSIFDRTKEGTKMRMMFITFEKIEVHQLKI